MAKTPRIFALCAALALCFNTIASIATAQPAALQSLWDRSTRAFDAGDYKAAEATARQSIDFATSRFGANHRAVTPGLLALARVYTRTDRVAEAEGLARRALAIRQQTTGPTSAPTAAALSTLGVALTVQARYPEAQSTLTQALGILERVKPLAPHQRGNVLRLLANVYTHQGRRREAEDTFLRAIGELERTEGRDGLWTLRALRQYASLLWRMGRHGEAEALYKRAIASHEQRGRAQNSETLHVLAEFASLLADGGRLDQAEPIFERALAAYDKVPVAPESLKALIQHGMGLLQLQRGNTTDAETNLRSAMAIMSKRIGPNHAKIGAISYTLAQVLGEARRYEEAEAASRKALEIFVASFGPGSAQANRATMQLGRLLTHLGRRDEGRAAFERGAAAGEALFGADHPQMALARASYSQALISAGEATEAFRELRRASGVLAKFTEREEVGGLATTSVEYRPRLRRSVHEGVIAIAWRNPGAVAKAGGDPMAAIDHGFVAAQHAAETSTSTAIAQMAARFAAGDSPLAILLRQAQDTALKARALDDELVQHFGRRLDLDEPNVAHDRSRLQKELEGARAELKRMDALIRSEFPSFDALTRTRALTISQVQELLAEDEALITMFVGNNATYVWAVSRSFSQWHRLERGDLTRRVEALRCGLEIVAWTDAARREHCKSLGLELRYPGVLPFDLSVAHSLYQDLLVPLETVISGKRLIVVPGGPLTSLPLQVLVATAPAAPLPAPDEYAKADWLVRRHAMSVIPTVASLSALRTAPRAPVAARPLIGFGAPLFRGPGPVLPPVPGSTRSAASPAGKASRQPASKAARTANETKDSKPLTIVSRITELANGLQPLPETAMELQRVATVVGEQTATLMLGAAASESNVKRAPMQDYRIIYFATHGLVADEVGDLSEPALALTLPAAPTTDDDGLLTASEVAQLRLNADWVVLSACNTAAGTKPGAEALSGLARAFFHAGARALLVSHWRVYSDAALSLTVGTFEEIAADTSIGRDEALRRSTLKMINSANTETTVPAYWAPFVVVGDGRGR